MELIFSQLLDGLSIGAVLLLAATGLAIVFGLMGVINLAHGEFMMIGAYVTFVVQNIFRPLGGFAFEAYYIIALVAAFVVTAVFGVVLEKTLIRRLYGRPLETLLATWGVSLILIQFVRSVSLSMVIGIAVTGLLGWALQKFLPLSLKQASFASYLKGGLWVVAGIVGLIAINAISSIGRFFSNPWFELPGIRIFIIILSALLLAAVVWFLTKSVWGVRIRAVTQNREMSNCLGIPTDSVDSITFGIGSGLAGVAGCAITLLGSVGPNLGGSYIVSCFMVIVLGGVGNLVGTIIASMMLGIIQSIIGSGSLLIAFPDMPNSIRAVVEFFATTSMSYVLVFIFIIAFLQFKPTGMFPQKGRSVEA
jgi:urea transport system permease protein